uniref:Protein kinase domain-containing protein n=1 Tax=Lactuca sativa TaxID=4236 RepID=A0A9R1UPX5_LACSA|nr:hypothetical protein LSAT_V11C800411360 [Lactuca sativa]
MAPVVGGGAAGETFHKVNFACCASHSFNSNINGSTSLQELKSISRSTNTVQVERKNIHKSGKIGTKKLDSLKGLPLSSFVSRTNSVFKTKNEKGSVVVMDYNVLESITNNFGESEILGVGGFGCVYKARLDDNLHVVVKRLDGINQDAIKEFQTEVDLLSKIHHPNIITLLGYWVHDETKLLVYELMHNGSLETQFQIKFESQNWDRHLNQIHAKGILGKIPGTSLVHETSHVTILIPMKIVKHSGSGNDEVMNEGSNDDVKMGSDSGTDLKMNQGVSFLDLKWDNEPMIVDNDSKSKSS